MAGESNSLTSTFMGVAIGIGIMLVSGVVDYSLFHNNLGGQWIIQQFDPILQGIFDAVGITGLGVSDQFAAVATGAAEPTITATADGFLNLGP